MGEHSLSHLDALMISHPPRTWQERGGWNFVNSRLQPLRPRGFQIFARLRVLWREFLLRRAMRQGVLPDPQQVLDQQADAGNGHPAAEAHEDGLAAGLHQLHDVGVQTDGCHGHDDEKLAGVFQEAHRSRRDGQNRGDDGSQQEQQHKPGEDFLDVHLGAALLSLPAGPQQGQHQRDGDNGQGPGHLHDGGGVQGIGAGMHSIPGGGRRSDGGGVVHRGAGKEAEALVGEAQHTSQSGEDQSRDDVEQEDHRDGLGDLLV
ncbi:putative deoxyribonuclease YcfH, partial [Dysosmobacter welbionis]